MKSTNLKHPMLRLFMRVFADCASDEDARRLSGQISMVLSRLSPKQAAAPKQYWKLPHLFEFTYDLHPATEASFHEILSKAVGAWHHAASEGGMWSIWNR